MKEEERTGREWGLEVRVDEGGGVRVGRWSDAWAELLAFGVTWVVLLVWWGGWGGWGAGGEVALVGGFFYSIVSRRWAGRGTLPLRLKWLRSGLLWIVCGP